MNSDSQRTVRFLRSWAINTLAVLLAVSVMHGHHVTFKSDSLMAPVITALVLGILNAFIRPILMLIALPLLLLTLGLFRLVINALILCLVSWLLPQYFWVDNFGAAFIAAAIISLASILLNFMVGGAGEAPPRPRQPRGKSGPGNGPVIDV